jgi:AraC-like DNA-binding protein
VRDNGGVTDWANYWRAADRPLEAMHAHFERHVYHRHSHETYSFGVTEAGAQAFTCRGAARTSAAGMVMAFNPDDPHDGQAALAAGSTRPARTRCLPVGVRKARELLDATYTEDLRADDLADAAGCSRFALHRAFVAAYGLAPSDYQRQLRLRAARRLLSEGHTPAEAAASAGFADQSHLTRWFKRYYGLTPGQFLTANMPQ